MKKFIRFICFSLILSTVVFAMNFVLSTNSDKDGIHIRGYFKEPKNTVDVLLIGASELYTGFNSPLAWKEFGFTSYDFSFAAMPGSLYEIVTKKALKTQSPKLLVFEINGFLYDEKYLTHRRPVHAWFDTVGVDSDGREYLKENIPKKEWAEYYFPLYKYHANWREPLYCVRNAASTLYLETEGISYSKAFANTALRRFDGKVKNKNIQFTGKAREYMTDLLEYCKSQGLENVLFVRLPHCLKNGNKNASQEIEQLVTDYGYRYADFENSYEQIGLNTQDDFYNFEHLNIFGMEKFTKYFGQYICDNYNIKTDHSAETVEQWNKCAEVMEKTVEECKNDPECSIFFELTAFETEKGRSHSILSKGVSGKGKGKRSVGSSSGSSRFLTEKA